MRLRRRVTIRALLLVVALAAVALFVLRMRRDALIPNLGAPGEVGATSGSGGFEVLLVDRAGRLLRKEGVPNSSGEGQALTTQDFVVRVHRTPWVVVVGAIDHDANRRSFSRAAQAAGRPDKGDRIYEAVELARQVRREDGSWGDWEPVDPRPTDSVFERVLELEPEPLKETHKAPELVEMLPYLQEGRWAGVYPPSLAAAFRGSPAEQALTGRVTLDGAGDPAPGAWDGSGSRRLIRAFDLDVVPGRTYRYRARIVAPDPTVGGPNPPRIVGPWSVPTSPVTVASPP